MITKTWLKYTARNNDILYESYSVFVKYWSTRLSGDSLINSILSYLHTIMGAAFFTAVISMYVAIL